MITKITTIHYVVHVRKKQSINTIYLFIYNVYALLTYGGGWGCLWIHGFQYKMTSHFKSAGTDIFTFVSYKKVRLF